MPTKYVRFGLAEQPPCLRCRHPDACPAATDNENSTDSNTCGAGYGPGFPGDFLCGQCDSAFVDPPDNTTFYSLNGQCLPCPDGFPVVTLIIVLVFLVAAVLFLVFGGRTSVWAKTKCFTNQLQFLSLTLSIDIQWPPFLEDLFQFFRAFALDIDTLMAECYVHMDWHARFFVTVSTPAAMLLVLTAIGMCATCACRAYADRRRNTQNWLARMAWATMLLSFLPLALLSFSALDCQAIDQIGVQGEANQSRSTLVTDTSVDCGQPEYAGAAALAYVVLLFLILVFLPTMSCCVNRLQQNDEDGWYDAGKNTHGPIYESFREEYPHFQPALLLKNVFRALMVTIVMHRSSAAAASMLLVMDLVYLMVLVRLQPWRRFELPSKLRWCCCFRHHADALNSSDIGMTVVRLVTQVVLLIAVAVDPLERQLGGAAGTFVAVLNIVAVLWSGIAIFLAEYAEKSQSAINPARSSAPSEIFGLSVTNRSTQGDAM